MSLSHSPKIVTDGLVFYVDAANIKSYPGSGNIWYDLSGNNLHMTMVGTPLWNNEGYFTGYDANNYFQCLENWSLILPIGDTSRTVIGIAERGSTGSVQEHIIHYGNAITNESYGISLYTATGNVLDHRWSTSNQTAISPITVGRTAFLSNRHGVLGTGSRIGVNKEFDSVTTILTANTGTSTFRVGSRISTAAETWVNGKIYLVLIYNRELSDDEIKQNFEALRGRFGI